MKEFLSWFDEKIMWGPAMIVFLLGSHIFLTVVTGFVQRYTFKGIKLSLQKENSEKGDLSIFGSLMTALSSTIGTGNIVGVGTAIILGGPGAVLWTWIGGVFGIATKYAESYTAVKYRRKLSSGRYLGGAMVTFEKFNKPVLAKIFAACCALGAFGIGCATQARAIVDVMNGTYEVNKIVIGLVLCFLTGLVTFGGIKSISKVCERLVPLMSIAYIIGCLAILFINAKYLPDTLLLIIKSAFTSNAVVGGVVGRLVIDAAREGIARGLFSNEAGMGSAPQATAASVAKNAVKPALVGSTGVFWDTVVVCLITGLVIVSSVIANPSLFDGVSTGSSLVTTSFTAIPFGRVLLSFGILTFAYSTILGWSYYGENCIRYLFHKKAIKPYRAAWIIVIFIGTLLTEGTVWTVADILNAAMVIPNMISVLMCLPQIKKDTQYYLHENHLDEIDPEIE